MKMLKRFADLFELIGNHGEVHIKANRVSPTSPDARVEMGDRFIGLGVLKKCFTLENGRYRVGSHWLREGFDDNGTDLDSLCLMISRNYLSALLNGLTKSSGADDLYKLNYCQLPKGDDHPPAGCLFVYAGPDRARAVMINDNVDPANAKATVENFIKQLWK